MEIFDEKIDAISLKNKIRPMEEQSTNDRIKKGTGGQEQFCKELSEA